MNEDKGPLWRPTPSESERVALVNEIAHAIAVQEIPPSLVIAQLVERGYAPWYASTLVNIVVGDTQTEEERDAATANVVWGLLFLLGGGGLTYLSWQSAGAGGTYFIMWGAMAVGAWRLLIGIGAKMESLKNQAQYGRAFAWLMFAVAVLLLSVTLGVLVMM